MARTAFVSNDFADLNIGGRIKSHRKARGLTLGDLAELTGISEATLSRIENDQTLINAHNLYILSKVLAIDITAFFETQTQPLRAGIRSVCRAADGVRLETARYVSRVLCSDIANKRMNPAINSVTARSLDDVGGLKRHEGEEFVYVISGILMLHSQHYEPLRLDAGDCVYFDANMGHAYVAAGEHATEILVLTTVDGPSG
jgi:DNA-binding XRE family transcriptional regulator